VYLHAHAQYSFAYTWHGIFMLVTPTQQVDINVGCSTAMCICFHGQMSFHGCSYVHTYLRLELVLGVVLGLGLS